MKPDRLVGPGASRVSVVIPVWNDAGPLASCLERLGGSAGGLELIVADASDSDEALAVATARGCRIVRLPAPNRGAQLNAGAALATREILIFSHADTELTVAHVQAVISAFDRGAAASAFYKDLAAHYPAFAWAGPLVRWWSGHFGLIYGDQSPAIRRDLFRRLGGFKDLPIMEDVEFSARLRRAVPPRQLAFLDPPLRTSMRRFLRRGRFLTRCENLAFIWLWRLRLISPARLHARYYRHR